MATETITGTNRGASPHTPEAHQKAGGGADEIFGEVIHAYTRAQAIMLPGED